MLLSESKVALPPSTQPPPPPFFPMEDKTQGTASSNAAAADRFGECCCLRTGQRFRLHLGRLLRNCILLSWFATRIDYVQILTIRFISEMNSPRILVGCNFCAEIGQLSKQIIFMIFHIHAADLRSSNCHNWVLSLILGIILSLQKDH